MKCIKPRHTELVQQAASYNGSNANDKIQAEELRQRAFQQSTHLQL